MNLSGKLGEDGEVTFSVHLTTPRGKSRPAEAILDTGGRYSLISSSLATALELKKTREVELISANAKTTEPVYYISMKINNLFEDFVPFVECKAVGLDFVAIGRPILKKWDIDYRGKKQFFEIRNPEE